MVLPRDRTTKLVQFPPVWVDPTVKPLPTVGWLCLSTISASPTVSSPALAAPSAGLIRVFIRGYHALYSVTCPGSTTVGKLKQLLAVRS